MKRISVFVYGDFNILHPGHLRLLKFAKESGDLLIVGVNADTLNEKNNLLNEQFRLEAIKATNYVDEAFILQGSVVEYIAKNKPDIVVKGKEHENKDNIEYEIIKNYGGKLLFTSGEISFSSLNLLRKEFLDACIMTVKHEKDFLLRHKITKTNLSQIIEKFKNLKIAVFGDIILDEYITCDAVGMSQEDPTIVVTPISKNLFLGGAAIVAAHAKSLGANVSLFSVVGDDEYSNFVANELEIQQISTYIIKDSTRPTTLKQRFRASGKTLLRVNNLKHHDISKDLQDELINQFTTKFDFDLVIFSDFSYGVLSDRFVDIVSNKAKEKDIFICADSQSSSQVGDISRFHGMSLVTPTEREIRLALNDFNSGLVVLSEKLQTKSNPKYIFTTLGSEGLMIYNTNESELLTDKLPALNDYAKDVSGAGDSMLISSSMALCVGANIWESAYIGSLAAAVQVSRVGNIPIKKNEIIQELNL